MNTLLFRFKLRITELQKVNMESLQKKNDDQEEQIKVKQLNNTFSTFLEVLY